MLNTRRKLLLAALFAWSVPVIASADTQGYPKRPLTIIVPFPPGGITDGLARQLAQQLSISMGQPVMVENKPGAAGFVAAEFVKRAPADGYTLFMGHMGTHVMNQSLFTKLPYSNADFKEITPLVVTPSWLVVHKDSPIKSVGDLIAKAKATTGGLTYASQGNGTGGQLLAEMLRARTGMPATHVPYRGSAAALLDLLANRVDFFFDSVSTSLPYVREGKLRAIAVATPERLSIMPEIPTMAEVGYPGVDLSFWFGMFVPAGTPDPIVKRLNTDIVSAMNTPQLRESTQPFALEITTSSPSEFKTRIATDGQRWSKVLKDANIKAE